MHLKNLLVLLGPVFPSPILMISSIFPYSKETVNESTSDKENTNLR